MNFITLWICMHVVSTTKIWYNQTRLSDFFKTKYIRANQIEAIEEPVVWKFKEGVEVRTHEGCSIKLSSGEYVFTWETCDQVVRMVNENR